MAPIDIYIDGSFLSAVSGTLFLKVSCPVFYADNIGEGISPVYFSCPYESYGFLDILSFFSAAEPSVSGSINMIANCFLDSSFYGTQSDFYSVYFTPGVSGGWSSSRDALGFYNTGQYKVDGFQVKEVKCFIGREYNYFTSVYLGYSVSEELVDVKEFLFSYTSATGILYDLSFSTNVNFIEASIFDGFLSAFVDSSFAGYILNSALFQSICGLPTVQLGSVFDTELIDGLTISTPFQTILGLSNSGVISSFESMSGGVSLWGIFLDVGLASGDFSYISTESFCGEFSVNNFVLFDVDLLSLKISDLSVAEGQFIGIDGVLCVDIVDDVYAVDPLGCYFVIDDVTVSGILSPIPDGYRMCYSPDDLFARILSATEFKVVARNINGDVNWRSFYLTSGYHVEYDNVNQDYGHGNKIVIRMAAENFASCPALNIFSYETEVSPSAAFDLPAYIFARPQLFYKNLSASVYPNSTAYFYGKKIKVEIRARDYAGNDMDPFIFEFRIENK